MGFKAIILQMSIMLWMKINTTSILLISPIASDLRHQETLEAKNEGITLTKRLPVPIAKVGGQNSVHYDKKVLYFFSLPITIEGGTFNLLASLLWSPILGTSPEIYIFGE